MFIYYIHPETTYFTGHSTSAAEIEMKAREEEKRMYLLAESYKETNDRPQRKNKGLFGLLSSIFSL